MSSRFGWALVVAVIMVASGPVPLMAGDDGPNTGKVSLSGGVDFVTAYYFRGIAQETHGFIAQPYVDIGLNILEADEGWLNSLDLGVGTWNSLHSEQTGASGTGPESWYESDFIASISATILENWSVGFAYVAYTSPNDAFNTVEEVDVMLGYNDAAIWEDLGIDIDGFEGLQPSMVLAFEVQDQADAGNGNVVGTNEGVYLELGISPGFTVLPNDQYPVTLTVPVTVGLSLDDYYESPVDLSDETFGYLDVGLDFSVPLAFIPGDYGGWALSAGVHFLSLGDSLEEFNGGEDFEVIGKFSLTFDY